MGIARASRASVVTAATIMVGGKNRPREQGFRVFCKLRQRRGQAQSLI